MKRISIGFLLTFMILVILSACKNDEWVDWKIANDQWLTKFVEAHKKDSNFYTTSSGLSYQIINKGWEGNRRPNINDYVVVQYKGSLINGNVFDNVYGDSTATFSLAGTIAGWQEALPKIHNGGHIKLYIPSDLGYGTSTDYTEIPPNSVLIFDINLLDSY
jgi:FKBP-type peptidyl-prolyl cis-trans isomerase